MRAIQIVEPRKIALLDDAPRPEPGDGEILVRCSHVSLCGSNMGQYTGEGHWRTSIPYPNPVGWAGHENIGTVVESRCAPWKPGDVVLAQPEGYFGFAEYIVARPPGIAAVPDGVDDPAPYMVAQPLSTVLRALTKTGDAIGQRCAVVGQGSMGLIFTQVLKLFGAREVIAIDGIEERLDWGRRFGADHTVNPKTDNAVEAVRDLTRGEKVDFVVEAVGRVDSLHTAALLVRPHGRLLVFGMPHEEPQPFPWYHAFRNNIQIHTCVGPECAAFFQPAMDMVADGRSSILKEMVFPVMPWDRAPEAFEMYANCVEGALKLTLEL